MQQATKFLVADISFLALLVLLHVAGSPFHHTACWHKSVASQRIATEARHAFFLCNTCRPQLVVADGVVVAGESSKQQRNLLRICLRRAAAPRRSRPAHVRPAAFNKFSQSQLAIIVSFNTPPQLGVLTGAQPPMDSSSLCMHNLWPITCLFTT